jgi:Leucine-rich repeat (LRR) protein
VPIDTIQYTGTASSWSSPLVSGAFGYDTAYSVTITITPKTGYYTIIGVEDEFFEVTGGTIVQWFGTNSFRVTFPATNKFPTITVGGQNGTMNAQTTNQVTFPVTTTYMAAGTYTATVNGLPDGVSVLGQVTINGAGEGTLRLVGSANALTGSYAMTLKLSVATSGSFTLTITGAPIFTVTDVAVINAVIQNNGLKWAPAPADGSSVPAGWNTVVVWDKTTGLNRRITGLTLDNEGLTGDMTLSGLTQLRQLTCIGNEGLASLNVSGITLLWSLDCTGNGLTSLDVSNCAALRELDCSSNQLTSLAVSTCTALEALYCEKNYLTSLNVSNKTSLKFLECWSNSIGSLNVSGCTALEGLKCFNNSMTSLDVNGLTKLKELDCSGNAIVTLDVSGRATLEILYCEKNRLTSLNVAGLANLKELYCHVNRLTELNLSGCTSLDYLDCNYNMLTSLNVTGCPLAVKLFCYDNFIPGEGSVTGFTAWDDVNFIFQPQKGELTFTQNPSFSGLLVLHLELYSETDLAEGVDGGSYPFTFTITAGALPPGLELSPDGIISGTPTALGHLAGTVTVLVTDDKLPVAETKTLTISYGATKEPLLRFTGNSNYDITRLKVGAPIVSVNVTEGVYGGKTPYTFSAAGLPLGIIINPATGIISGSPAASGMGGTATITVTDSEGTFKSITISFTYIMPSDVAFANSSAFNIPESMTGTAITPINVSGGASGGAPPYRFTSKDLPPGITISLDGIISGTPTGSYPAGTAMITLSDEWSSASIFISYGEVGGPLAFFSSPVYNIPASPAGKAIANVDVSKGAAGGIKPYTFSATGLPAGLSINPATGVISGTPSAPCPAGTATITVTDKDGASKSITISYGAISEAEAKGGDDGGGSMMIIIAVVAVVAIAGGAAAYFFFLRPKP